MTADARCKATDRSESELCYPLEAGNPRVDSMAGTTEPGRKMGVYLTTGNLLLLLDLQQEPDAGPTSPG